MGYREIPGDRILKFPATPGFKGWKVHFTEDSITHPAKMNLNLLRWILKTYTSEGDVVCDPMAGTGSTVVLAALMGRHAIAVEYEPRFCEMIRENIKRTSRQSTLTPKGRMTCIQGDARELSKLLKESDTIVTSPPYSDVIHKKGGETKLKKIGISSVTARKYSKSLNNIGNLPHGDIDAVITSPPYGEAQSGGGIATKGYDGPKHSPTDLVGKRSYMPDKFEGEENISRLKYGKVDAVVSSPPYGNRLADEVVQDGDEARISYRQAIDSIVTSPPYEGMLGHSKVDLEREALAMETDTRPDTKHRHTPGRMRAIKAMVEGYPASEDNIGNLKSESYLSAMLEVYRECHKVLKPEGVMVLVTKNFIRDKAVVRLDLDTIKLCEAAGFHLSDRWYFKLPSMSFWRILYRRNYPDAPQINYEDILVFTKESMVSGAMVTSMRGQPPENVGPGH